MKTEIEQPQAAPETETHGLSWSDSRLVAECVSGNERAWSVLVDRYKRLIYSIPLKYGARPEDAADIFQSVCMELLTELPRLRKTESLRSWLMTITAHKAYHWKKQQRPNDLELDAMEQEQADDLASVPPEILEEAEREQMVREAIASLPERCAELVRLLFYQQPPLPYAEVARRLGLATGSIGFIRGRCLKRLEKRLLEMGL